MTANRYRKKLGVAAFALQLACAGTGAHADEAAPWAATAWGGWGTDGNIEDLPGINSDFENSWFTGFGLAREFARSGTRYVWEVEAIAVRHFGWQRHWEGDLALGLRRNGVSLGPTLQGSVAVATGLSWTSRLPALEQAVDPDTKRLLQYLALEIDVARRDRPDLSLVLRLHHRSSAWGLYGTDAGGSNFVALGLRRRF